MKFKGWKNFKKNEIVIYAIALMLVTAGYFNYTTNLEQEMIETSVAETSNNTTKEASIGDARLVNSNDVVKNENIINETNDNKIQKEDIDVAVSTEDENKSEATNTVETNTQPNKLEDYFVNSKLERDTGYASMISTYTKILEDNTISETQKSIAMKEITKINNTKNAISVSENLLSTKGFTNSVVLVNNDSVNVVIQTSEKLSTAEVAQIQNIVSREFSVKIENIHITEKN